MAARRMSPEHRRNQLLDVGAELFAEKPYEDVLMEDVADRAGVTRGLMYHYFPNKRDFYTAIFQRASDRLLATADVDDDRPFTELLEAAVDTHIQYFLDNARTAATVNRGALSGDPAIQAIIARELDTVGQRLLDKLQLTGHARHLGALAIQGWLVFGRTVCVEWTQSQSISRSELTQLCLAAFTGAIEPALTLRDRSDHSRALPDIPA
ncbi:TetR/AcrR family transcriptional regulator [Nocardia yamanashiensis]|uniref:TetR/AcrR family transcriptional regulator n=1 Tax=Nocardia yamanashiensis TaxID=209247 RepID=UPI001E53E302|nr:TetR/AcrR family transcriptional regulator [Nocardia yamanashiensis]UGT44621.1 TetR/AcrR family transcriptional regulator [Nocardia yamanashiensis]